MTHKILHTSDWHIGRRLKEHDRAEEFAQFFTWLEQLITSEKIDTLLVAGDIFDNTTPSVQAQDMYYSFLSRLVDSPCRHVVITSGNHDSPAFLDAPADLLKHCRIHVIGQARENAADEVITLYDSDGQPEVIVCAVPYLRDRDVRTLTPDDNPEDSDAILKAGIREHYAKVFAHARDLQGDSDVPIIAMGHMFIHGGVIRQDDGVRSLYVGTAIDVESSIFPEDIAYTALGHLHSPQKAGRENARYSGSPIPMGFGEAGTRKSVCIVEVYGKNLAGVREVDIPVFQRLERVSGNMEEIFSALNTLARLNVSVWADVTYTGEEAAPDLQEKLHAFMRAFPLVEILSVYDMSKRQGGDLPEVPDGLDSVNPMEMLELCFKDNNVPQEQRDIFTPMYQEILRGLEVDY